MEFHFKLFSLDGDFIKESSAVPSNFTGMVISPARTKCWYLKDILHRIDGPAVEYSYGRKEWWIDGNEVTEKQCKLLHDIMKLKGLL